MKASFAATNAELSAEYQVVYAASARHSGLSAQTRRLIDEQFGGEYGEAERVARITVARSTRWPGWMSEVLGAQGCGTGQWRDPLPWAVRR